MANTENKVRTGRNTLGVMGILKSYKLIYKKAREIEGDNVDFNGQDKGDKITGSFTLLVGEVETITINLSYGVSEFKSYIDKETGKPKVIENKNFILLKDMYNEKLPTIADVENKEDAAYIQLSGKGNYKGRISENIYKNSNDIVVKNIQYELGYGNLYIKDKDKVKELYAQFTADVYVKSVTPETKINSKTEDEEETGRVEMKVYIPTSKGSVVPLTLIAQDDMAEAIKENVDEEGGETLYVEGTIHCSVTQKEEDENSEVKGWGKKRKEIKTVYKNELIIDYAEPVEDEEDEEGEIIEKAFKPEDIKAYVVERENIIENVKNGESNNDDSKSERKGFGSKSKDETDDEEEKPRRRTKRW